MKLTKRCDYAIRAVSFLAHSEKCVTAGDIAAAEKIPAKFLESVLLKLRKAGIIDSKVGAGGGYRLKMPLGELNAKMIVDAMEGEIEPNNSATRGTLASAVVAVRLSQELESITGKELAAV